MNIISLNGSAVFCCLFSPVRNVTLLRGKTNPVCVIHWQGGNTLFSAPLTPPTAPITAQRCLQFCYIASWHQKFQVMPSSSYHCLNRFSCLWDADRRQTHRRIRLRPTQRMTQTARSWCSFLELVNLCNNFNNHLIFLWSQTQRLKSGGFRGFPVCFYG